MTPCAKISWSSDLRWLRKTWTNIQTHRQDSCFVSIDYFSLYFFPEVPVAEVDKNMYQYFAASAVVYLILINIQLHELLRIPNLCFFSYSERRSPGNKAIFRYWRSWDGRVQSVKMPGRSRHRTDVDFTFTLCSQLTKAKIPASRSFIISNQSKKIRHIHQQRSWSIQTLTRSLHTT